MSKGHGKIQRRLLEILGSEDRAFETFELAALVFDVPPNPDGVKLVTDAQIVTTRRALQKLASESSVFALGYGGRRKAWASERVGLPLKILAWQDQNLAIAISTDPSRVREILRQRTDEMQPLLNRAAELGLPLTRR